MQTDNENQLILNESALIEGSFQQLDEQELDAVTGGQIGRPARVSPDTSPDVSPPLSPTRFEMRFHPRSIQRTTSSPAIASNLEQLARVREQIDTISSQRADRLNRSKSF